MLANFSLWLSWCWMECGDSRSHSFNERPVALPPASCSTSTQGYHSRPVCDFTGWIWWALAEDGTTRCASSGSSALSPFQGLGILAARPSPASQLWGQQGPSLMHWAHPAGAQVPWSQFNSEGPVCPKPPRHGSVGRALHRVPPGQPPRLPLGGTSEGFWSSPRNWRRLCFPPGLFPLGLFIVSAFSSLWLEDQHVDVQQDWSPGVSPFATWKFGNRRIFLSSPKQIWEGRRGSFSEKGSWNPGPRISGQDPLLVFRPSPAGTCPLPVCLLGLQGSSSSLPYPQSWAEPRTSSPPLEGLQLPSSTGRAPHFPALGPNLHPAFPIGWSASAQK